MPPKERQKRPRVTRGIKKYKALFPEYFGFEPDYRLVFEKTNKGYKAVINSGAFIGFPRYIIEGNKHLFLEIV